MPGRRRETRKAAPRRARRPPRIFVLSRIKTSLCFTLCRPNSHGARYVFHAECNHLSVSVRYTEQAREHAGVRLYREPNPNGEPRARRLRPRRLWPPLILTVLRVRESIMPEIASHLWLASPFRSVHPLSALSPFLSPLHVPRRRACRAPPFVWSRSPQPRPLRRPPPPPSGCLNRQLCLTGDHLSTGRPA